LKPDKARAKESYQALLSVGFAEGEFRDGVLTGAVLARPHTNAYAAKGSAAVDVWIGSLALLDRAVIWWNDRPLLRALCVQFPNDVRPAMYRALRMRGFVRSGDTNVLWR
jgi:hypothetical protein